MKTSNQTPRLITSAALLAALLVAAVPAHATTLYWDPNTTGSGWGVVGDVGTWGTSAFWTADSGGNFITTPTGVTTTTNADVVRVNSGNLNNFTMSVSGDVQAQSIYFQNNGGSVTGKIDNLGGGTLHLYGVGSAAPAIDGANQDTKLVIAAPIILEQEDASVVYLGVGGGNNGSFQTTNTITSTHSVNLYFNTVGNTVIDGSLNITGSISCTQDGTAKGRSVTINGIIGSGVTNVTQTGTGTTANTGLVLNNANLHTGTTKCNAGTLGILNRNALQYSTLDTSGLGPVSLTATAGSFTFGGLSDGTGARNLASVITVNPTRLQTLVLNPQTGKTPSYSGAVGDLSTGMNLTKTSAGTQTLSGVNTYTGATTINGGVLALGASGTINNTSSISIAAGAGFDVSAKASGYTWSGSTTLSASGTGTDTATAAVIMGHADQTIAMGAQPITMNLAAGLSPGDTTHPALYVATGNLSLGGNQFTVNTADSAVLADGTYRLIQVISATITDGGGYPAVTGTAVTGKSGSISVSSGNVILTVTGGGGYASWAATYAGSGLANEDYDHDGLSNGVEYFMNITTPGFTASPALDGSNTITWTNGGNIPTSAYGTQFVVQTSTDLVVWQLVPSNGAGLSNTNGSVSYTLPTGQDKLFCRLMITPQ